MMMHNERKSPYDDRMPWTHQADLRAARKRAQLTQDEAARLVGVKERTWGAWERGAFSPSEEHLRAIVEKLQVPPELVGYSAPEGWELVPAAWIQEQFAAIIEMLEGARPR